MEYVGKIFRLEPNLAIEITDSQGHFVAFVVHDCPDDTVYPKSACFSSDQKAEFRKVAYEAVQSYHASFFK